MIPPYHLRDHPADLVTEGPAQWLSPSLPAPKGLSISGGTSVDGVGALNCATNPNYPDTEPRMSRIKTRTGPSVSGSTVATTHFSNQSKQMNPLFQQLNRP